MGGEMSRVSVIQASGHPVDESACHCTQILPGLYVGSLRDARNVEQIKANGITHVLYVEARSKAGDMPVCVCG